MTPAERSLATILFTDIVGSTERAAQLGDRAWSEALDEYFARARAEVRRFGGQEANTAGDGFLATFKRPAAALRCAAAIRSVVAELGIQVRSGLHAGEVEGRGRDLKGLGVHIGARVGALAGRDEILVSSTVRELVAGSGFRFADRGKHALKGVPGEWSLFALEGLPPGPPRRTGRWVQDRQRASRVELLMLAVLLAIAGTAVALVRREEGPTEAAAPAPVPEREAGEASIAVLPFENMSADPENEYFADGLAEEILNALAGVPGLQVAARTSSFSFKEKDADIPTIAEALGVRTVLEGSVRKAGERVRITAQLVNAEDGLHLWSETYDRDLDDIFVVQEEIARAIVAALEVRLTTGAALVERPTESREAYEEYLRGLFLWNRRTVESLQAAIGRFERAVELDPEFALAWAGLADAHLTLQWYLLEADWEEILERGREAAERALAIDPDLAQAHVALGLYEASRFRWAAADSAFRRGLQLDPRYATGHYFYAHTIGPQGRLDEAIEHARVSVELDPLSLVYLRMYGIVLMWAGRYDEALAQFDRVRELDPNFAPIWMPYAKNHVVNGRWEEATTALVRRAELMGGDPEVARHVVALMERHASDGRPVPIPADIGRALEVAARTQAGIVAMLGQHESAMTILERMYEENDPNLREAVVDPWLAPLHSEPRFVALMGRIGLAPVEASRSWMEER